MTTEDRPAQLSGIEVNGAPPAGRIFRVGDTLTIKAIARDPGGRPLQYMFDVLNGHFVFPEWQSSDTFIYTLTPTEVNASFSVRVFVRNDDGRVLDSWYPFDASGDFGLTVSE